LESSSVNTTAVFFTCVVPEGIVDFTRSV